MTHEEFFAAIDAMTVLELNDLVHALEEEFGVSAAAMAAPAAAPMQRITTAHCNANLFFFLFLFTFKFIAPWCCLKLTRRG